MFFSIGGLCSLGCPGCFLGTSWKPIHNYVVFIILGNTPNLFRVPQIIQLGPWGSLKTNHYTLGSDGGHVSNEHDRRYDEGPRP